MPIYFTKTPWHRVLYRKFRPLWGHALVARYRKEQDPAVMTAAVKWLGAQVTPAEGERLLLRFVEQFPTVDVYRGEDAGTDAAIR